MTYGKHLNFILSANQHIIISSNLLILTSSPWRQCGTHRHDGIHDLPGADVEAVEVDVDAVVGQPGQPVNPHNTVSLVSGNSTVPAVHLGVFRFVLC